MPNLVILVLDDVNKLLDVLAAWHALGASGATILESSGLARVTEHSGRDDMPLFPGLRDLLRDREVHHRTLFTVVDDTMDLDAFFDATERVVGKLDAHGSGIMLALPVAKVRGLVRQGGLVNRR
jgi:hypothetical protein